MSLDGGDRSTTVVRMGLFCGKEGKLKSMRDRSKLFLYRKKLFRVNRQHREEIKLSPQERDLIHYMAQKNQANNCQAIVCHYQE
jgi:hypothetical protein